MSDNDATVTTAERARLFGTTPKTADLGKSSIIASAGKRGRWQLQPSVSGYVKHLHAEAAGRGNEPVRMPVPGLVRREPISSRPRPSA